MHVILPTRGSRERYPKGHLIQGFGENKVLYQQSIGMPGHNGWDIVPVQGYGEDIIAPHDGVIGLVSYQPNGYGNRIDLISPEEDGKVLVSILGHMTEQQLVTPGQQVKQGDVIGKMGNSGFVVSGGVAYWGNANPDKKGTHCHWTTKWMIPVVTGQPSNTSYLGQAYKIINYLNGFAGSFDPLELFEETMFKNYKVKIIDSNGEAYGVLTRTPNTDIITKAEDEIEWRSYSKPDSYNIHSINTDGSTDWSVDQIIDLR